ncbi:FBD-like protein, partial [Tanacetum coccineum]
MEWQTPFNLPSLKTLNMFVYSGPSLNAIKLIRGCPILESLSLTVSFRGQPEDYIFNIPTLKHLNLEVIGKCRETISKVVLNVPNLEDLFIGGQWCSQFVMEDFPSLVMVNISFVLWIEHLRVELLKGISGAKSISFKPDFGYHVGRLPKFPNYEHLELISRFVSIVITTLIIRTLTVPIMINQLKATSKLTLNMQEGLEGNPAANTMKNVSRAFAALTARNKSVVCDTLHNSGTSRFTTS